VLLSISINYIKQEQCRSQLLTHFIRCEFLVARHLPFMKQEAPYRVRNSPPVDPVLSQVHLVHNFETYFPNIHSKIILPSKHRSFRVVSSLQVFVPEFCTHFSSVPCVLRAPPISSTLT